MNLFDSFIPSAAYVPSRLLTASLRFHVQLSHDQDLPVDVHQIQGLHNI